MTKTLTKGTKAGVEAKEAAAAIRERDQRVAVAAYFLAEKRGFQPGAELDDWILAERSLDPGASQGAQG